MQTFISYLYRIADQLHIIDLLIIAIVALLFQLFSKQLIARIMHRLVGSSHVYSNQENEQREKTLSTIVYATLRVIIWMSALLYFLGLFDIRLGPLFAGAGVAGIALGFGAQAIIKDFLSGIFILTENQYRIGDVVTINQSVSGTVEQLTLRMTVLRDLQGQAHYIPNGTIELATNQTIEFSSIMLTIGVSYDTDIDAVERIINAVGEKLATDEAWKQDIREAPHMLRLDAFGSSSLELKIACDTAPSSQWKVKGELLRRLKKAFDENNIELPYQQIVVHQPKPAHE